MFSYPIGIVLYNPSISSIKRINFFAEKGVQFYIFDNSQIIGEKQSFDSENIKYFSCNKNLGLSFSLNYLCKEAIKSGKKSLLFFDQDTIFTYETLVYVDNLLEFKISSDAPVFKKAVSINFRDINLANISSNVIGTFQIGQYFLFEIMFSINSGTLYFLDKFNYFNWFDEKFFVDGVDYSFSLNSNLNGYKNLAVGNVVGLNHSGEQDFQFITLFGKKWSYRIYSFKRNSDFLISHLRLFLKSFKVHGIKPKYFICKAIFGYVSYQLLGRILFGINTLFRVVLRLVKQSQTNVGI